MPGENGPKPLRVRNDMGVSETFPNFHFGWSIPLITIGSAIYCNAFLLIGQNKHGKLFITCSYGNIWWKFLFGPYIPRHRLESVIAKYSKHPHLQLRIHLKTLDCRSTSHARKIIPQAVEQFHIFKQRWRQRGKTYGTAALNKILNKIKNN